MTAPLPASVTVCGVGLRNFLHDRFDTCFYDNRCGSVRFHIDETTPCAGTWTGWGRVWTGDTLATVHLVRTYRTPSRAAAALTRKARRFGLDRWITKGRKG